MKFKKIVSILVLGLFISGTGSLHPAENKKDSVSTAQAHLKAAKNSAGWIAATTASAAGSVILSKWLPSYEDKWKQKIAALKNQKAELVRNSTRFLTIYSIIFPDGLSLGILSDLFSKLKINSKIGLLFFKKKISKSSSSGKFRCYPL